MGNASRKDFAISEILIDRRRAEKALHPYGSGTIQSRFQGFGNSPVFGSAGTRYPGSGNGLVGVRRLFASILPLVSKSCDPGQELGTSPSMDNPTAASTSAATSTN